MKNIQKFPKQSRMSNRRRIDDRVYERNLILELKGMMIPNLCEIATFYFKEKSVFFVSIMNIL